VKDARFKQFNYSLKGNIPNILSAIIGTVFTFCGRLSIDIQARLGLCSLLEKAMPYQTYRIRAIHFDIWAMRAKNDTIIVCDSHTMLFVKIKFHQ
jgi:hypothetical protein